MNCKIVVTGWVRQSSLFLGESKGFVRRSTNIIKSKLKYHIKKKSPLTHQQINKTIEDAITDIKEKGVRTIFHMRLTRTQLRKNTSETQR